MGEEKVPTLGWKDAKAGVKNFDRTLARSNAKLKLCSIGLMLKRLATA